MNFKEFVAIKQAQAIVEHLETLGETQAADLLEQLDDATVELIEQLLDEGSGSIANLERRLENPNLSDDERAGIRQLIFHKLHTPNPDRSESRYQKGAKIDSARRLASWGNKEGIETMEHEKLLSIQRRKQQQGITRPTPEERRLRAEQRRRNEKILRRETSLKPKPKPEPEPLTPRERSYQRFEALVSSRQPKYRDG